MGNTASSDATGEGYQTWDLPYAHETGGGCNCPANRMSCESVEFAPTLEHVMTRSEFGEFKSQVQEVCHNYWSYGKTLPAWFRLAWPRFLILLFVVGVGIVIYSLTLPADTDEGSTRAPWYYYKSDFRSRSRCQYCLPVLAM